VSNITLSSMTVVAGPGSAGTTVGAVTITMSDGSVPPATLTVGVNDCTTATPPVCTASTHFSLSSVHPPTINLLVNPSLGASGLTPGSYPIQMTAQ
jgi:hypothetical protein